jgi:hypothetical protein
VQVWAVLVDKLGRFHSSQLCLFHSKSPKQIVERIEVSNKPTIIFGVGGGEGRVHGPEDDSVLVDDGHR